MEGGRAANQSAGETDPARSDPFLDWTERLSLRVSYSWKANCDPTGLSRQSAVSVPMTRGWRGRSFRRLGRSRWRRISRAIRRRRH